MEWPRHHGVHAERNILGPPIDADGISETREAFLNFLSGAARRAAGFPRLSRLSIL